MNLKEIDKIEIDDLQSNNNAYSLQGTLVPKLILGSFLTLGFWDPCSYAEKKSMVKPKTNILLKGLSMKN